MENTITDYDKNIILDCLYDYQKWFDKDESQYESIEEVINKLSNITTENKIKAIIKYVENPKFSEDSESSDYLSDGEMLEIVIDELKKLIKQ